MEPGEIWLCLKCKDKWKLGKPYYVSEGTCDCCGQRTGVCGVSAERLRPFKISRAKSPVQTP